MERDFENFDNDDIYGLDEGLDESQEEEKHQEEIEETPQDTDILTAFLQSKGIDPSSVKMQNEDGETEEIDFNDLSREEQLQLLNYNPAQQDEETGGPDLAEDEEKLLSILRQNNMSVQEYLSAYKRHVIEQYQAENPVHVEETFNVDDYTDEELFIADLKDKVPDLTEEEAMQELELQRSNPALFEKKMTGLRASYKEREQQIREFEKQQAEEQAKKIQEQQAQQAAQFEQLIVDTIQNNASIDLGDTSLELSENDMNQIASFILDSDSAGVRYIAKALNDPKTLVEMAWWALKGHDALNQVTQYYKKQIADARKSAKVATKPKTVVTKRTNKPNIINEEDIYDSLV